MMRRMMRMRGVRRGKGRVMIEVSAWCVVIFDLFSEPGNCGAAELDYWPEDASRMLRKSLDPWGCRLDGAGLMSIRSVWWSTGRAV